LFVTIDGLRLVKTHCFRGVNHRENYSSIPPHSAASGKWPRLDEPAGVAGQPARQAPR
jgi:hypothetical protein